MAWRILSNKKIWVTGHSLGGAVPILFAFRLQHEGKVDVQGVHTFGAPAVGDINWKNAIAGEILSIQRWVLEGDPAPHPLVPLIMGEPRYYHVGMINNLYHSGVIQFNDEELAYSTSLFPCGTVYGFNVTHMNYWPRLHQHLMEYYPSTSSTFPESLPGKDEYCN